jgi:hypothetical protein
VLGYGLHARDLYRNLPYVVAADRNMLVTEPDVYLDELYRRPDSPAKGGGRVAPSTSEEP